MVPHGQPARNSFRESTPIYLPHTDKVIGVVRGGEFCKTITGSLHMLRTPPSIAFDLSTLDAAEAAGAAHVAITDRETGKVYRASIADVRYYGKPVVRGHGRQIGLALDRYSIDGETPEAERRAAATNQERNELQMSLFGGVA